MIRFNHVFKNGMFKGFLKYKLAWLGGELLLVDPKYTSQTCPKCDHKSKDNRTTQAHFECVKCGYQNNADHVGALNVCVNKKLDRAHMRAHYRLIQIPLSKVMTEL